MPATDTSPCSETPVEILTQASAAWGIVSAPQGPAYETGVIIVTGGLQYRVGAHRQSVLLARQLAAAGFTTLRFDLAGLGDATGDVFDFETLGPQLTAALEALTTQHGTVKRVVLWGLCDGASAALLHWRTTTDPRIAGLCLVNPWVRSDTGLARTHIKHYYGHRLTEWSFWRKLLAGGVGPKAIAQLMGTLRTSLHRQDTSQSFQQKMALAWRSFPSPILLLISERDLTGQEFMDQARTDKAWQGCLQMANVQQHIMPGADHTCSTQGGHELLGQLTLQWLLSRFRS